jgi:hypothetical protein
MRRLLGRIIGRLAYVVTECGFRLYQLFDRFDIEGSEPVPDHMWDGDNATLTTAQNVTNTWTVSGGKS